MGAGRSITGWGRPKSRCWNKHHNLVCSTNLETSVPISAWPLPSCLSAPNVNSTRRLLSLCFACSSLPFSGTRAVCASGPMDAGCDGATAAGHGKMCSLCPRGLRRQHCRDWLCPERPRWAQRSHGTGSAGGRGVEQGWAEAVGRRSHPTFRQH